MMSQEPNRQVIQAYGMTDTINESLSIMTKTRPIDYAVNYLTLNIMLGMVLGLPIAALTKKDEKR